MKETSRESLPPTPKGPSLLLVLAPGPVHALYGCGGYHLRSLAPRPPSSLAAHGRLLPMMRSLCQLSWGIPLGSLYLRG
jgi:hypothetical protein